MFIHPEIMAGVIAILFVAASRVASTSVRLDANPLNASPLPSC